MRILEFTDYGGPELLHLADRPAPHAGPGHVRVAVVGASINPIDWKIREGLMAGGRPLDGPGHLGVDAAGVVDEIGDGVTDVTVGDQVFGLGTGTQAEHAVLRAWAPKPGTVDWAVAAAVGLAAETAERGLRLLGVEAGTAVFVDGGAGGVGSVAVQLAVASGATVIASASEANHDYLQQLGATPVRSGPGVTHRVRDTAGPSGVDAVLDVVGKTPIEELVALVLDPAQVVSLANFAAAAAGARVTSQGPDSRPGPALSHAADLMAAGQLTLPVHTFPFERAVEAYRTSQGGHVRGKLVLVTGRAPIPHPTSSTPQH